MKSIVKKAVAGLVAGAALVGAVAPAAVEARPYHGRGYGAYGGYGYHGGYRGYRGYRGVSPGAAVGLGIAGLALGAALAAPRAPYGYGYDYAPPPPPPPAPGYYGYGGYGYPYGRGYNCRSTGVYDPYIGRYVQSQTCY